MAEHFNDGGPAFPRTGEVVNIGDSRDEPGMTLRDYFAAKAMQGMYAWTDGSEGGGAYEPAKQDSDFRPINAPVPYCWCKAKGGYWRQMISMKPIEGDSGPHEMVTTYEFRLAREAYRQADAMLAARTPKPD